MFGGFHGRVRPTLKVFQPRSNAAMASARARDRNKQIVNEKWNRINNAWGILLYTSIIFYFFFFILESLLTYMSRGACKVIK